MSIKTKGNAGPVGMCSVEDQQKRTSEIAAANPAALLELIAEIERLKGENEELQENVRLSDLIIAERNRLLDMFDCPIHGQCVPHAMDEVLSLRKDAERYRWLRDKSESIHQFYMSTPIWFTGVKFNKENVDNTIDAAMSKESSHG